MSGGLLAILRREGSRNLRGRSTPEIRLIMQLMQEEAAVELEPLGLAESDAPMIRDHPCMLAVTHAGSNWGLRKQLVAMPHSSAISREQRCVYVAHVRMRVHRNVRHVIFTFNCVSMCRT